MARTMIAIGAAVVAALLILNIFLAQNRPSKANFDALTAIEPTDEWFREKVFANPKIVVVDFNATWCGPCRMMDATLKELAEKYGDRIDIVKVDVDAFPKVAADYQVSSIPFLMIFQQRQVVGAELGVVSYEYLESLLQPLLNSPSEKSDSQPPASQEPATPQTASISAS